MKKIVFTFDDGVESHYTRVAPLFKEHGMAATFFVTGQRKLWKKQDRRAEGGTVGCQGTN